MKVTKASNVQSVAMSSKSHSTPSGIPPKFGGASTSKSGGASSSKSKMPASKANNPFSVLETVHEEVQAKGNVDCSLWIGKKNVAPVGVVDNMEKVTRESPVTRKRNQYKK